MVSRAGEFVLNGDKVCFGDDEKVQGMDGGAGCTTM